MKTKKVQKNYDPEMVQWMKTVESEIVNSVYPSSNLTYEGLQSQELSPVEGEEDNWFDFYINQSNKRRSR